MKNDHGSRLSAAMSAAEDANKWISEEANQILAELHKAEAIITNASVDNAHEYALVLQHEAVIERLTIERDKFQAGLSAALAELSAIREALCSPETDGRCTLASIVTKVVADRDAERLYGQQHARCAGYEKARLAEVERERDAERLRYGQQHARCAVFMGAMAWLARRGEQERAQRWIAMADAAASDVRPEDFVVAKAGGGK